MEQVSNILFWIASGLLVPVIVGLLFFFAKSLVMLGGFAGQYIQRVKHDKQLCRRMNELDAATVHAFASELEEEPDSLFIHTARTLLSTRSVAARNRLLSAYEVAADACLGKYKVLVKFGPILGLMGTLIPMGPALAGLSTGDIASMAYNMQVAFATTVLGLFSGAVGFILLQVNQRWFTSDLVYLDFLADLSEEPAAGVGVAGKPEAAGTLRPAGVLRSAATRQGAAPQAFAGIRQDTLLQPFAGTWQDTPLQSSAGTWQDTLPQSSAGTWQGAPACASAAKAQPGFISSKAVNE